MGENNAAIMVVGLTSCAEKRYVIAISDTSGSIA